MNWNEKKYMAKNTSIIAYLRRRGIEPVKRSGKYTMYKSLWRKETKASLAVINDRKWEDYGESGEDGYGDLIDLIMRLDNLPMKEAVNNIIGDRGSLISPLPEPVIVRPPSVIIVHESPTLTPQNASYVTSRSINLDLARLYLVELHVKFVNAPDPNKVVPVIGFKNDMGGYELRTDKIKLSKAPKSFTTIAGNPGRNDVYEGFFSFLAHMQIKKESHPEAKTYILNSLSFMPMVTPLLSGYGFVNLDNDTAGDKATVTLLNKVPNMRDCRDSYSEYNDWNDKLLNIKL